MRLLLLRFNGIDLGLGGTTERLRSSVDIAGSCLLQLDTCWPNNHDYSEQYRRNIYLF